jgi:uncharacterized iron-regulated membrane protein
MTLPLRRLFFWLHLSTGLVAGTVVFVMAATGVLLAYERQIVDRAEAAVRRVTPGAAARPLPVEELVRRARAARPEIAPTGITIASDPGTAAALALGREDVLYVDPYTGDPTGEGSRRGRGFFRAVTDLHRFLGGTGERREIGRAATGAANLAFLVLVLSGLYLWVPRSFNRRQVRNVAWFRRGLVGKARNFNWHNTIGLWIALPLVVIVASGAVMSYDWANALVYKIVGGEPPKESPRPSPPGGTARGAERAPEFDPASVAGLDPLFSTARGRVAGWRTITLRLPKADDESVSFSIARSHRGRPDLRDTLELDRKSGAVVKWQPFSEQSAGRRARSWLRFLHTGEAGGLLGQSVAGLASAGSLVMVWTGFALAWRRFFPRRAASVLPISTRLENGSLSPRGEPS